VCYQKLPSVEQIKDLLRKKNYKGAISLVEELESEGEMSKDLLSFVHAQVGFLLLFDLHFKEAVDHFLLSDTMQPSEVFPFIMRDPNRWSLLVHCVCLYLYYCLKLCFKIVLFLFTTFCFLFRDKIVFLTVSFNYCLFGLSVLTVVVVSLTFNFWILIHISISIPSNKNLEEKKKSIFKTRYIIINIYFLFKFK